MKMEGKLMTKGMEPDEARQSYAINENDNLLVTIIGQINGPQAVYPDK